MHEYILLAIDKTIGMLKEQGFKYRKLDFDETVNSVYYIGGQVVVQIFYSYGGARGKKLKNDASKLLNYINVRIKSDRVKIAFPIDELEVYKSKNKVNNNSCNNDIDIEKIMDKISKLLELSNSPNENEAIAASLRVQKLLAKYNLDIAEVKNEEKEEEIKECVADVGTGSKWKYELSEIIARSYCCKVYFIGASEIIFYGYSAHIVIARRVFSYLFEIGNRLAKAYEKTHREEYKTAQGIYGSFCSGFIAGIDEQLSMHCKALALVVPQEVSNSFQTFSEGFKELKKAVIPTDVNAFSEGLIEGQRALNSQYIERT